MSCNMPESGKFPSQKRFLWTNKEVDLAPHPVVSLVLQVGDAEKFPQALGFEGLGPCFTATVEDGGDKRLEELELACDADGVPPPGPL